MKLENIEEKLQIAPSHPAKHSGTGGVSGEVLAGLCRRRKTPGFHPWVGKIPLEKGLALQSSCLENPMDRGAWRATVHGVAKSRTGLQRLGAHAHAQQSIKGSPCLIRPPRPCSPRRTPSVPGSQSAHWQLHGASKPRSRSGARAAEALDSCRGGGCPPRPWHGGGSESGGQGWDDMGPVEEVKVLLQTPCLPQD